MFCPAKSAFPILRIQLLTSVNFLERSVCKTSNGRGRGSKGCDKEGFEDFVTQRFKAYRTNLNLGLLMGSLTPIQYAMRYSTVWLEDSDWDEPTIMWPLLHSPSGTRKSVIHRFVRNLNRSLENEENENTYQVNEITFENLGIVMENNNG